MRRSEQEVKPRNEETLVVGGVARISGCGDQKEVSQADQTDRIREEFTNLYSGEVEHIFTDPHPRWLPSERQVEASGTPRSTAVKRSKASVPAPFR
jgi:hypothetical protein